MREAVVAIGNLSRRFGSRTVLNDVSLDVPRGSVFGLVGENGAGKTTLIKHILGLLRAEAGTVRVFGLDPVADPVSVLGRIGYLSEQPDLPGWMRVDELIRYTQAFYPRWDPAYAEELREQFGLDPAARIKSLSKGQRAKLGLLAAQAHRPDLLLLDEPSSGLDPIVRRDILEAVIRTVATRAAPCSFPLTCWKRLNAFRTTSRCCITESSCCAEPSMKSKRSIAASRFASSLSSINPRSFPVRWL